MVAAVSQSSATYKTLATMHVSQNIDPRNGHERLAQQATRLPAPAPAPSHRGGSVNIVV